MNPEFWTTLVLLLALIQDRVPWRKCPLCRKRTTPRDLIKTSKGRKACDSCILEGKR